MRHWKVAALIAFNSIRHGSISVTLLTTLILVLVGLNLLFVPALITGSVESVDSKLRDTYVGDIVVEPAEEKERLKDVTNLVSEIETVHGVTAATIRNRMGAQIEFQNEVVRCDVYGVNPESERVVFRIHEWMLEGNCLISADQEQILLGVSLAGADQPNVPFYSQSLEKVHAGDNVSITYANGSEKSYSVKGIFYTESLSTDLQAYVSEKEFLSVDPTARNQSAYIHIRVAESADLNNVIREISGLRNDTKVRGWRDYAGVTHNLTRSFDLIRAILDVVNFLVAGATVFIITYIDVAGRKRHIGVQRAIGITPFAISLSYLMRAVFYAVVSFVIAVLVFLYGIIPLEVQYPFHFTFGYAYLQLRLPDIMRAGLIILGASFFSVLIAVTAIIRGKIVDAICS